MLMNEILSPSRILAKVRVNSKKRLLELLANEVSKELPEADANNIFDAFLSRERLGSTAMGEGIAIPHCRVKQCKRILGFFVQLESSIDFDAMDGKPVDLIFAVVVPVEANDEHLQVLSEVAKIFSQANIRTRLRNNDDTEQLLHILTDEHDSPEIAGKPLSNASMN